MNHMSLSPGLRRLLMVRAELAALRKPICACRRTLSSASRKSRMGSSALVLIPFDGAGAPVANQVEGSSKPNVLQKLSHSDRHNGTSAGWRMDQSK